MSSLNNRINEVDIARLPQDFAEILDFLSIKIFKAPPKILLGGLIAKTMQVTAFKQVSVAEYEAQIPETVNIFVFLLAGSGEGKDYPQKLLETQVYKGCFDNFQELKKKKHEQLKAKIKKEAEEQYHENEAAKRSYIKEENNKIRLPRKEIPKATGPALEDDAIACFITGLSGIFLRMPEWGQKLEQCDENFKDLMISVSCYYDGDFKQGSLRGNNKYYDEISNIPINALFASSHSVFSDPKVKRAFFFYLKSAFARRSLLAFVEIREKPIDRRTPREKIAKEQDADAAAATLNRKLFEKFQKVSPGSVFIMDEEAYSLYCGYCIECEEEENKIIREKKGEILQIVALSKKQKAKKLAGLCAFWNHPEELTVTLEDMDQAIYMTELLSKDYEKVIRLKANSEKDIETEYRIIFDYFVENIGKPVLKGHFTLSYKDFGLTARQSKGKELDEILDEVGKIAKKKGYRLEYKTGKGNGKIYTLHKTKLMEESGKTDQLIQSI